MRDGDEIEAIDSAGQRFTARLTVGLAGVRATLMHLLAVPRTSVAHIAIAQGVPKGQKMDFVVEKLTELGVAEVLPFYSERTVVNDVPAQRVERWRRLATSAALQCGRADVPAIAAPVAFAQTIERFGNYDAVLFPWELAEPAPLRDVLPGVLAGAKRILVCIGPEGGFSDVEMRAASDGGARVLSLGPQILRTETAGMALTAILVYLTAGDPRRAE